MHRLLLLFSIFISTWVLGQQTTTIITPTINCNTDEGNPENWTEYFSNDQITIEYKFVLCDPEIGFDQEQVILKMTNHTSDVLKIDWHILLEYNQVCKTCDYPDEYGYHVFLKPNQTKEGDCSIHSEAFEFKMFSKFMDDRAKQKDILTSFTLSDFTLTAYPLQD
jgi:hypothetical protein